MWNFFFFTFYTGHIKHTYGFMMWYFQKLILQADIVMVVLTGCKFYYKMVEISLVQQTHPLVSFSTFSISTNSILKSWYISLCRYSVFFLCRLNSNFMVFKQPLTQFYVIITFIAQLDGGCFFGKI